MKFSHTLFIILTASSLGIARGRDPFWPIGYDGKKEPVKEAAVETRKVEPEAPRERVLSDDELRELARKESERIRQTLDRKGTMIAGGRIYAYVQEKWVTTGDVITVEVLGNSYRLEILNLTTDNIELEAHRAAGSLQPQTKKIP
jgi:hypothetical protein